jgi:hypothetical protein
MNDMYLEEIRLSRELARAIEQITDQYGRVVPESVYSVYLKLVEHYRKEMELGVQ